MSDTNRSSTTQIQGDKKGKVNPAEAAMMASAIMNAAAKEEVVIVDNVIKRIRHWKIEKKLGQGATATVYLGRSLIDNTLVAIKQFTNEIFENNQHAAANRKMMMNEAALVGKVFHPNILQTYSVGMESAQKYLVMEFVDMGCLEDYINPPNNFGLKEIIRIYYQCGAALQYSDEIGVIHRDIKPANILLNKGRIPKVTDFGSSMLKGDDKNAVSGVGSPSYMSSEQIRELPLNQQTDIYSLGVSLFEMITGVKPYIASSQYEMIFKILNEPPPQLSKYVQSGLPQGLEDIVIRCMQKNQKDRYLEWADYLHDMVVLINSIYPIHKRITTIDEITAFDFVRGCSSMKIFEDSELWDLIQMGVIYKVSYGTAFTIAKPKEKKEEKKDSFREFGNDTISKLYLSLDEENRALSEPQAKSNQDGPQTHTFVLSGAIQTYGNGSDNRISVLQGGDYYGDLNIIDTYTSQSKAQAYAIDDTTMMVLEDKKIAHIHPVVRDKLNLLIKNSQETQRQILTQRHAKVGIQQAVKEASTGLRLL